MRMELEPQGLLKLATPLLRRRLGSMVPWAVEYFYARLESV